jgi:hypothetical protein
MRYMQSYKEKQELERAALISTGLISERYADVSSIQFQITYYHGAMHSVLMKRTISFLPANYASFHMKCMQEGCMDGGYDLAPVVASLAKSRKKSAKGKVVCRGKSDTRTHASIAYEINIQYNKLINKKTAKKQLQKTAMPSACPNDTFKMGTPVYPQTKKPTRVLSGLGRAGT